MLYSILLAGGLSSRMGQDKSKLTVAGETLLERSLTLLKSTGSERIILSGDVEGYASVPDLVPHCGPLGGVYSSLTKIKQEYGLDDSPIVIIPVDMPRLNTNALNTVVANLGAAQCCHFENEVFPCVMRASENLYTYLQGAFSANTSPGGKRSMKALMEHLEAKTVNFQDLRGDVFVNMNNPEDWQAFIENLSER